MMTVILYHLCWIKIGVKKPNPEKDKRTNCEPIQ